MYLFSRASNSTTQISLHFEQFCTLLERKRAGALTSYTVLFFMSMRQRVKNFNKFIPNQHFIKVTSLALSAKETHSTRCTIYLRSSRTLVQRSERQTRKKAKQQTGALRNEFNRQHKADKMQRWHTHPNLQLEKSVYLRKILISFRSTLIRAKCNCRLWLNIQRVRTKTSLLKVI